MGSKLYRYVFVMKQWINGPVAHLGRGHYSPQGYNFNSLGKGIP